MLELDGRFALQEYLVHHDSNCNWPKYQVRYDNFMYIYLIL